MGGCKSLGGAVGGIGGGQMPITCLDPPTSTSLEPKQALGFLRPLANHLQDVLTVASAGDALG